MKLNKMYPSKYFRAADVAEKPIGVTIETVVMERIGDDVKPKPVVSFSDAEQRLVLNKTNGSRLAQLFGSDDTEDWHGEKIYLVCGQASFGSRVVDAVRIISPAELVVQEKRAKPAA